MATKTNNGIVVLIQLLSEVVAVVVLLDVGDKRIHTSGKCSVKPRQSRTDDIIVLCKLRNKIVRNS